jgi:hypothetical protein
MQACIRGVDENGYCLRLAGEPTVYVADEKKDMILTPSSDRERKLPSRKLYQVTNIEQ